MLLEVNTKGPVGTLKGTFMKQLSYSLEGNQIQVLRLLFPSCQYGLFIFSVVCENKL